MQPIITVENLGKRYRLGRQERYHTLRDSLVETAMLPVRGIASLFSGNRYANGHEEHVWALRDVCFEVAAGDVVGLIGSNGAGKSTLLKILSRITEPTLGCAKLHGRVGSLLEVGTGFHPELTGRENIFLSGAILGMRRAEIARKFDEIVAFADIEQFIDTPVKRYSSGMYVRLAFAVAAHLEPEILLVDEVLAVGDASFQKRCLGRIGDVAREGRTVLFVSHSMASIEALCGRCLLLKDGRLKASGETNEIISQYMAEGLRPESASCRLIVHSGRRRGSVPLMTSVSLHDTADVPSAAIRMGTSLSIAVSFSCSSNPIAPVLGIVLKNAHGVSILGVNNRFIGGYHFEQRLAHGIIRCTLDSPPLLPGTYSLDLYLNDGSQDLDIIHDAIFFDVLPADIFGTGQLPPAGTGVIYWPASFAVFEGIHAEEQEISPGHGRLVF